MTPRLDDENVPRQDDERRLASDDDAFVRRVADAYTPPPRTAAQRVAFQAKLEERLQAEGRSRSWMWGAAAVATAAAAFLLISGALDSQIEEPAPQGTMAASEPLPTGHEQAQEEAILAIVIDPDARSEDVLPEDYQAIASVFLGEEA
jgi:hypothetical protein